jgi:hypothetical protein
MKHPQLRVDVLEHLHDREMENFYHFGKVRQVYEKRLRDPNDVFMHAEERKKNWLKNASERNDDRGTRLKKAGF